MINASEARNRTMVIKDKEVEVQVKHIECCIEAAILKGEMGCLYNARLNDQTIKILKENGYTVKSNSDIIYEISW